MKTAAARGELKEQLWRLRGPKKAGRPPVSVPAQDFCRTSTIVLLSPHTHTHTLPVRLYSQEENKATNLENLSKKKKRDINRYERVLQVLQDNIPHSVTHHRISNG